MTKATCRRKTVWVYYSRGIKPIVPGRHGGRGRGGWSVMAEGVVAAAWWQQCGGSECDDSGVVVGAW